MTDIKAKIAEVVKNNPKRYTQIINKDPELLGWVNNNTKTENDKFSAKVYSAIYDVSDVCEYNNIRKFDRFSTGFIGCGPASVCECTRTNISKKVSHTKTNISDEEKIKINEKRKSTMLEKYGVEYNSQREEVKDILSAPKINNDVFEKLNNYDWLNTEYVVNKRTTVDIGNELKIHNSTVIEYLKKYGFDIRQRSRYSRIETEIVEYIKSISEYDIIENTKSIINPYEIDIYIPELNIAFEVNGLYWHSYGDIGLENKNRHLNKTKKCRELGIQLIHITDWEWKNKCDIIKSIILSKLGKTKKIYARKCSIVEIDSNTARSFFDKNHLSGFIGSQKYIALEYDNEVVMCMSFGKNRFGDGIELHRMATKLNTTVVGGSSKLMSYYTKTYEIKHIKTYCDYSKSYGNSYEQIGFKYISKSSPGYFWTDGDEIYSRYKTQKHKLKVFLGEKYKPELNERDNMMKSGYRRYWDCGNLVFEYAAP